jgi:hypothetical protein
MMNRSLDLSWFKAAFDYLNMFRMGAYICRNCRLIFYSLLNVYSLIAIHQTRHSSSERSTSFIPNSDQIRMPCAKGAAASTRTCKLLI